MDLKELRGLYEAYSEVYAPIDEASRADDTTRANIARYAGKKGISFEPGPNWDPSANRGKGAHLSPKQKEKQRRKALRQEEFELWVNALVEEGYDLSDYTWDEMYEFYLDEAEGSYGQTPKARAAMGRVAIARREKPASEYSQKGEKTKKVKEIEKHTRRIDNGPDAGNRGKKSTKPRWSGFAGKSGRGKMDQDSRDYARERDVEYTAGGHKSGPGTVTKNPKKLRKQKAMGEIGEQVDIFDLVLEFLQAEGYAETLEEAEWMMANELDAEDIDAILEEIEQLDEISLKTKMGAYARSQDPDADYQYGSKVHSQGERIKKAIVKKHGEKAGEHAERHADAQHWGRKDASGKSKGLPKPRIQKNRSYRTTKAGKMHGQDQSKLKRDLKYNRFVED